MPQPSDSQSHKPKYSDDQRAVALSFLRAALGQNADLTQATDKQIRKAAKLAAVATAALNIWIAQEGGKKSAAPVFVPEPEPEDLLEATEENEEAPEVLGRPDVPEIFFDSGPVLYDTPPPLFAPAHDLGVWARETFIVSWGELHNPDHWHLGAAKIGFLWTNVYNGKNQKIIIGSAELVGSKGDKWQTGRDHYQLMKWFGCLPDFVITLSATHCADMDDATFCALVEHELYHCSIKCDEFNIPKETPDGDFIFSMRGHDVEQFTGVVARYGVKAAGQDVEAMVEAARQTPLFSAEAIRGACCGAC